MNAWINPGLSRDLTYQIDYYEQYVRGVKTKKECTLPEGAEEGFS